MNKCAFFDRDGVINKEQGYISNLKNFIILPHTLAAINFLKKNNYLIIIITNQAGVGSGYIKLKELQLIHSYLIKKLKYIDDIYFCPYHPEYGIGKYKKKTKDRKPGSGMLLKAIKKWNINPKESFMVGDKKTDFLAAKGANVKFYYKDKNINLSQQIRLIINKTIAI